MLRFLLFICLSLTVSCSQKAKLAHQGVIGLAVKNSEDYMKSRWSHTKIVRGIIKATGGDLVKIYGLEKEGAGFDKLVLIQNAKLADVSKDKEMAKHFVLDGDHLKLQKPLEKTYHLADDTCVFQRGNDLVLCGKDLQSKFKVLGNSYADSLFEELSANSKESVILVAPESTNINMDMLVKQAAASIGFFSSSYERALNNNLDTLKKINSLCAVTLKDESIKVKVEFKDDALGKEALKVFDGTAGNLTNYSMVNKMKLAINSIATPSFKYSSSTLEGVLKPKGDRVSLSLFLKVALELTKLDVEASKEEVKPQYSTYVIAEKEARNFTRDEVFKLVDESFKIDERKYEDFFKYETFDYSYSGLPSVQHMAILKAKAFNSEGKEMKVRENRSSKKQIYVEYEPSKESPAKLEIDLSLRTYLKFDKFELTKEDIGKVKIGKMSSVKLLKIDNDAYALDTIGGYILYADCFDDEGKPLKNVTGKGMHTINRRVYGKISKIKVLILSPPEKISVKKAVDLKK